MDTAPYGSRSTNSLRANSASPRKMEPETITEPLRVFVRIRPFLENERKSNRQSEQPAMSCDRSSVEMTEGEVRILDPRWLTEPKPQISKPIVKKSFTGYDKGLIWSFGEDPWVKQGRERNVYEKDDIQHEVHDQSDVYRMVEGSGIVQQLFDGYSHSFFAFGQINAGKTYTIFGTEKSPGLVHRFLEEIVSELDGQTKARAIKGEDLDIYLKLQSFRVYKEEIEDMMRGFPGPALRGEACKLNINEIENATSVTVRTPEDIDKVAQRIWAGKEAVRKPSTVTQPEKNNRSSFILNVTMVQESTIETDEQKVTHTKQSTLSFIDLGGSGKADSETPLEYKKIIQSYQAFQAVLRKFAERSQQEISAEAYGGRVSGSGMAHIPYTQSNLTKLLQDQLGGNSLCTGIFNISPWHKHQTDTVATMASAEDAKKCRCRCTPQVKKGLEVLRSVLEERVKVEGEVAKTQENAMKVKAELENRQNLINRLKNSVSENEEEIAYLEVKIEKCERAREFYAWRLAAYTANYRRSLPLLQHQEDEARAEADLCRQQMEQMEAQSAELQAKAAEKNQLVLDATNILQRCQGLKALVDGKPLANDDGVFAAPSRDAEFNPEYETEEFASTLHRDLKNAVERLEKAVSLNKENTKLLDDLHGALTAIDETEQKKGNAEDSLDRARRKAVAAIRESLKMMSHTQAGQKGVLQQLDDVISSYTDVEARSFFYSESLGIDVVLGPAMSDHSQTASTVPLQSLTREEAPGWSPWSSVVPVRTWLHRFAVTTKDGRKQNLMSSSLGQSLDLTEDGRLDVSDVTFDELHNVKLLVDTTKAWTEQVLQYAHGRKVIEDTYQRWLEIIPKWPQEATRVLSDKHHIKKQDKKTKELEEEHPTLVKDNKQIDKEIDGKVQEIATGKARKGTLEAELKKLQSRCCSVM